jgi:hypothetical protein
LLDLGSTGVSEVQQLSALRSEKQDTANLET